MNEYDYGFRFYDPALGRFHTLDPLAEKFSHQSSFVYADNNPVRFIDYMGMNADDFYFDTDGRKLIKYVENNEPDRVFIAAGESTAYPDSDPSTADLEWKKVNMSSAEIEDRMNDNGYKKVTKEKTVEVQEMTTFITDSDGDNRVSSNSKVVVNTLDEKTKYTESSNKLQSIQETHLYTSEPTKHEGTYMIEKKVERWNYNYDRKDNRKNVNKVAQLIFKVINTFQ